MKALLLTLCAWAFAVGVLDGATTTTWEMNTYQDFLKGKYE